jgi:predicted TPR repeat methyltransferase
MGPPPDRLAASRRLDMALGLLAEGLHADAAEAARAATEADPAFAEAWFTLGEAAQQAGEADAAEAAFRRYLDLVPEDRHGAVAHLVQLGRAPAPDRLPAAYVRALFDDYAPRFDRALREGLGYCGPELLAAALAEASPGRRFADALDLGCGTGLMAPLLRPLLRPEGRLTGLDLSPAMLAQARRTGLYDALVAGDLVEHLATTPARHDLIVAADVLVYLGDLAPALAGVARCLAPGGLFAATLERDPGAGVRLQATQRYAHGEGWLRAALAAAGLRPLRLEHVSTRQERGQPVPGLLLLATGGGQIRTCPAPSSPPPWP